MRKKLLSVALIACMMFGTASCDKLISINTKTGGTECPEPQLYKGRVLTVSNPDSAPVGDYDKFSDYMQENTNDEQFMNGVNQFAIKSMASIFDSQEGNVAYSPLSLYFALAMAAEGSNGTTREQMFDALQISEYTNENLAKEIGKLYRKNYYALDDQVCNIANSIWMGKDKSFEQSYIDCIRDDFYAELFTKDLQDENVWGEISQWISDKTNGMLKPSIKLDPETIMAIINTIYFKGGFTSKFDEKLTKEDIFTTEDGTEQKSMFMNQRFEDSLYQKGENYVSYSMEFGENGSIQFILPNEGVSMENLVTDQASVEKLLNYEAKEHAHVNIKLPKIDYNAKLNLISMLKSLGMTDAFDEFSSDFSKMTKSSAYISDIIQEVRVKFEEKGVEAAAYTMIVVNTESCELPKELPEVNIDLDRPFMYAIKNAEGNVLFTGIIRNMN